MDTQMHVSRVLRQELAALEQQFSENQSAEQALDADMQRISIEAHELQTTITETTETLRQAEEKLNARQSQLTAMQLERREIRDTLTVQQEAITELRNFLGVK